MGNSPPTSVCAFVAIHILLCGLDASAADPTSDEYPPATSPEALKEPSRVRLVIVSHAVPRDAVEAALGSSAREHFDIDLSGASGFSFDEWYRARRGSSFDIDVWLLRLSADTLGIYFASTVGDRFIARELRVTTSLDEMDREALAQVIETSLRALDEERIEPMSRDAAARLFRTVESEALSQEDVALPPEPTSSPPTPRPESEFRKGGTYLPELRLAYALSRHSKEAGALHGLGFRAGLDRRFSSIWLGLGLEARYALPLAHEEDALTLDSRSLTTRLEFRMTHVVRNRFAWGTAGGIGFTTTWWSARSAGVLEAAGDSSTTTPSIGFGLFGQLRSTEVNRFELGFGVDMDLKTQSYAIERGDELDTFLRRDPLRPFLYLGTCFL